MKRTLRLCSMIVILALCPLAANAQGGGGGGGGQGGGGQGGGGQGGGGQGGGGTTGGTTGGGYNFGATTGGSYNFGGTTSSAGTDSSGGSSTGSTGATSGTTSSSGGGGGGGTAGSSQATTAAVGASLTQKAAVYSTTSGVGSATTIPSNTNFLSNTYVHPLSLGMPSLYATQYGAQNVITTSGGPTGKFTYLYVPAPTAVATTTTAATTAPGFTTYGVSRAPVYSTVLGDDLPIVQHAVPRLLADIRGSIERSSTLKSKGSITVSIEGNVVMLRGEVGSERELRIAEGLARMTPGVGDVRNELKLANSKNGFLP